VGAVSVAALREQIRILEGGARVRRRRAPSGVGEIDALVGGLPRPGLVEISGQPGLGATRFGARLAAAATRAGRVAWIDTERRLFPPALAEHGVILEHLLVIRPPAGGSALAGRGSAPEAWATEQVLRSGCFALVLVSGGRIDRATGHRWGLAAEHGQSTGVILRAEPARELPAEIRLQVVSRHGEPELVVTRDRAGITP
jgi:hypothetical protein